MEDTTVVSIWVSVALLCSFFIIETKVNSVLQSTKIMHFYVLVLAILHRNSSVG